MSRHTRTRCISCYHIEFVIVISVLAVSSVCVEFASACVVDCSGSSVYRPLYRRLSPYDRLNSKDSTIRIEDVFAFKANYVLHPQSSFVLIVDAKSCVSRMCL